MPLPCLHTVLSRKFAEMSSKFRFGQEFVEKPGISPNFVDRCLHYFCTILYMAVLHKNESDYMEFSGKNTFNGNYPPL